MSEGVRHFNGRTYRQYAVTSSKSLARSYASVIRGMGGTARVIREGKKWVVYKGATSKRAWKALARG